jgi:hypothetical protein
VLAGSLAALEQLGVPAARIHTEQFGWSGAIPVPAPATDGGSPPAGATSTALPRPRHGGRHGRRSART